MLPVQANTAASAVVAALAACAVVTVRATAPCQTLTVDPWGADSFRVRCNLDSQGPYNGVGALEDSAPAQGAPAGAGASPSGGDGPWTNGNLMLALDASETNLIASRGGEKMATISLAYTANPTPQAMGMPRVKTTAASVRNLTTLSIEAEGTDFSYYGFGEHEDGVLDHIGNSYDMET